MKAQVGFWPLNTNLKFFAQCLALSLSYGPETGHLSAQEFTNDALRLSLQRQQNNKLSLESLEQSARLEGKVQDIVVPPTTDTCCCLLLTRRR